MIFDTEGNGVKANLETGWQTTIVIHNFIMSVVNYLRDKIANSECHLWI